MAKSKLTEAQVAEIKEMYSNGGVTHNELAETYGVGVATIRRMLAGVKGKDDVAAISTSKTVTNVLTAEEKIEFFKQQLAEAEASKQRALEARYIELGKWAHTVIGDADVSAYKIVKRATITTDDNVGQGMTYTGTLPLNESDDNKDDAEYNDNNDNNDSDYNEGNESYDGYNSDSIDVDNLL